MIQDQHKDCADRKSDGGYPGTGKGPGFVHQIQEGKANHYAGGHAHEQSVGAFARLANDRNQPAKAGAKTCRDTQKEYVDDWWQLGEHIFTISFQFDVRPEIAS